MTTIAVLYLADVSLPASLVAGEVEYGIVAIEVPNIDSLPSAVTRALPLLGEGAVLADLTPVAPSVAQRNAEIAADAGIGYVDVFASADAWLACGTGAATLRETLENVGIGVTVIGGPAGVATRLGRLELQFRSRLRALLHESEGVARALNATDWFRSAAAADLARVASVDHA